MSTVVCWFKRTLKQLEREQTDRWTDKQTDRQTDRQTDTHDDYRNPLAHARRGLMKQNPRRKMQVALLAEPKTPLESSVFIGERKRANLVVYTTATIFLPSRCNSRFYDFTQANRKSLQFHIHELIHLRSVTP